MYNFSSLASSLWLYQLDIHLNISQVKLLPILDYGDILYMIASATILNEMNTIYHSALRFITGAGFRTHHCFLYQALDWPIPWTV